MTTGIVQKGEMTERVKRLRSKLIDNPPVLSVMKLKVYKKVMAETEGEHILTRRAKIFERYLDEVPLIIDDNPIVGNITEQFVAVYPQPQYSCDWMPKQDRFNSQLGDISYSEEDMKEMKEAVAYWEDRCIHAKAIEAFRQVHKGELDPDPILEAGVFTNCPLGHPLGTMFNYNKVLKNGLNGVIAEVEAELGKLTPGMLEDERKRTFYDAMLICLRAVIKRAWRYAALAQKMAKTETNAQRKKELLKTADALDWVPANPARSFYEAVQSFWFIFAASHMMDIAISTTPGRLGQFLNPLYVKERDEGKITQEEAIELIELLFLRMLAIVYLRSTTYWQTGMGQTNFHITLGGLTPDGEDATCEMDWLILEAQRRARCIQPTLSVLVHNKMSQEFLLKCVEVVKETGMGQPAFMNNDVGILQLLRNHPGASLEEAREVTLYGCVPARIPYRTDNLWSGSISIAKMLELALNDGKDPLTGVQLGPRTGKAESFRSIEEMEMALRKQMQYFLPIYFELTRFSHTFMAQITPLPFQSALIEDCIKKSKDVTEGGAKYQCGGIGSPVGMVDVANSLIAMKKLIFDEKKITMAQLKQALAADFEGNGNSEMHRMCLDAPKYGNDNIDVDNAVKQWYDIYYSEVIKYSDFLGRPIVPSAFSISYHFGFGRRVGALPCGRKAKIALTDATVSAMPGTDRSGPTALAKSAARVLDATKFDCNHFNMKFHPSSLASRESMKKLLAVIKTYMDLGGYHVQFNVVSAETLKDAQVHPEKYRDLLVRVAGFSAFYIYLDKGVQDEIIKRTELSSV